MLRIDEITIGERDRTDPGDITSLAESIAAVGLLHPVVVTEDHQLIAGERRLAAVVELGWAQVPITVVTLETAADALRAELDENTCRKPLTPVEASKARERRVPLLAPKAAEHKAHGETAPGRPKQDAAANLAGASSTARETRKVAAVGTGYSSSTLDKVDKIRDAAERGVIRRGKTTVPAPEPVQEVARAALADVEKTGAAVDASHRKVDEAIHRYVEDDVDVRRARLVKGWFDALATARRFREFDVSTLKDVLSTDDWDTSTHLVDGIAEQVDAFRRGRNGGLRVINGGNK
jgi:hypothetical protein